MAANPIARARAIGSAARARRPLRFAFAGLFATALLCFLGLGAVLPVLPRYVKGPLDGGDVAVGVVTGAFAFTAVVFRPIAGRLTDARGRRAVLLVGALLSALAGALYFVPLGVPGLIAARLVLGMGEGFVFTAGATWTVDLAPEDSRGRSIGLFGLAIWTALTIGPVIGEGLRELGGYDAVWAFAAAAPFAGAALVALLPDSPVARRPAGAPRQPWLAPEAVRPGLALAMANVGYAALAGFLILHLEARGSGHGAAVFTAFATAVVAQRLLAGRLPDVIGPRRTAVGAACAEALGLALIGLAHTWVAALPGAVIMGAGFSVLYPSLALIVVERVGEERRGTALGGFTAFFDVGVGLGAPLAGVIASAAGYPEAFYTAAVCALVGALLTATSARRARTAVAAA
jgi:MFS family permease